MTSKDRLLQLTKRLLGGGVVTSRHIVEGYGVSWATAKRDMATLEANLPVSCTALNVNPGRWRIRHELRLQRL